MLKINLYLYFHKLLTLELKQLQQIADENYFIFYQIILKMLPAKIILPDLSGGAKNKRMAVNIKSVDMYIYFQNQILAVQKEKISQCELIKQSMQDNKKFLFIFEDLNTAMFGKVISYLHGGRLELTTMKQLADFLDCIDYLGAVKLLQEIQVHIEKDIQNYQIFCLIQLAYKFGLQRIFDLCLSYLQLDQFQQIKYNKFDFLQCDFKLVQIILRRHHVLKMRGKIQGLDVADIQQVIETYCYRNKINQQALQKLKIKYVKSIQNMNFVKNSLRLQKLAHKNIFQSANIEADEFQGKCGTGQAQQICDIVINSFRNSKRLQHNTEAMEESAFAKQLDSSEKSISFMNISNTQDNGSQYKAQQYKIKINLKGQSATNEHRQEKIKNHHQNVDLLNIQNIQEADSIASKISTLLNGYQQAFKEHETKFSNLRKNAKSMVFNENENKQQTNSKLISSSKLLTNPNLMFTIYIPSD